MLRAMSTIRALMQQVDELLHLAQAEAAAAQQASQELHALRQWAAAQGVRLPALTGGAYLVWLHALGDCSGQACCGAPGEATQSFNCIIVLVAHLIFVVRLQHTRHSLQRAIFLAGHFLCNCVKSLLRMPVLCFLLQECYRRPKPSGLELIGCLQGMKESLRGSKGRTHPQGRQSTCSMLQQASLQTGQGSWSRICYMPCMTPGRLTLMPGGGLQLKQ